ncbi:MAG: YebC/PmpR family DNA-binding transcriptional regulator [Planctomycetota bacterium]|nr:YebC/PmpR family DNA-binding transcriptional regulator [Planctomycetota bacterium]
MAGHSHFANIMHKKGRADAKRGKAFSKISRLIMAAVRMGGPNERDNPRLSLALLKARAANMPKDTIKRAIARASGTAEGVSYEELVYEGYGPGGVAMLVETLTDNRNRTGGEVRVIFDRNGGSLGSSGSVAYLFERKGQFDIPAAQTSEEQLFDIVLEAGAEEIEQLDEGTADAHFQVTCEAGAFDAVEKALEEAGIEPTRAEIVKVPSTWVEADESIARKIMRITDLLDDHDDVQSVTTNLDISAEVAAKLAAD